MSKFKLLDTSSFDNFINNKNKFIDTYESIQKDYIKIVDELMENWKGKGAEAFYKDAMEIKTNISNIGEILQTMCDMLIDCKKIYEECDKSIKEVNKNAL